MKNFSNKRIAGPGVNDLKTFCRRTAAAISLSLFSFAAFGQADIHFTQFYETSILRNPAMTGVFGDDYKLGAYYRNQWSSISNPFTTFLFTAESHMPVKETSEDFISFGLLSYYDKAGTIDQKITTFYPALNYNKCLNTDKSRFLSFGFTGGYMQYSFDPSKTTFNNQYVNGKYNPANPSMENLPAAKMTLWDLGAGINYNTSSGENNDVTYIVGVSGYHFTQPKFSYYQKSGITQNMRLNGNFTLSSRLSDMISYQLHANYAMQGTYREIMLGGILNWTQHAVGAKDIFIVSGGLFYRYGDAICPVFKMNYTNLSVAVSYDVNVSSLKEASNMQGGFELTVFYNGNFTNKTPDKKTVCPKF